MTEAHLTTGVSVSPKCWVAGDPSLHSAPPAAWRRIMSETERLGFDMPSDPDVGAILKTLAASKPAGRFLEIGTGTGLSTCWLLAGMDEQSALVSVDTDARVQNVAYEILGSDRRLQLVLEDGAAFLDRQSRRSFDLIFADAMPGKYVGLDTALDLVAMGGIYLGDDMLPQPNWPDGHEAMVDAFFRHVHQRRDFVVLDLGWASGVVVLVRSSATP
jgi:predicted O-methyltransferase YrrM